MEEINDTSRSWHPTFWPHIQRRKKISQERGDWDFPEGPVVKSSPSNAGGASSIPGRGAKIPHASRPKNQNIKQRQYCNKFSEDLKNGPHQKNLKIFKEKI